MQFETWLKTDMKEPLKVVELDTSFFSKDQDANIIGVEVTDNGEPVTLSGDVHGYIISSSGTTVPVDGTLSGNRAQITLNRDCYLDPGGISIAIKVDTTTVAACHGYIYRTETDTVVDPEHVIPSINEILEQIRKCELATAAANTAAGAANTAAGAANTAADDANLKANRAQSAANTANTAANRLNNLTVSAQSGSTADAQVSDVDNHKHIAFTLPVGATPDIKVTVENRSPGTGATVDIDTETSPYSPEMPLITFGIPEGQPGSISNATGETIPISGSDATKIKTYVDNKNGTDIPISSTDATGIKAYIDAVDAKVPTLETLFEQNTITGADFDGTYLKNATSRCGAINWIGLYRFGKVIYFTVLMTVTASAQDPIAADSIQGIFSFGDAVKPIRALRTVAISANGGQVEGIVSFAASDGAVSFIPKVTATSDVTFRASATFFSN